MKWTDDKPKVEGWYWHRRIDLPHKNEGILHVHKNKKKRMFVWDEMDAKWDTVNHYNGQWAGPIPSPEETMQQRRKRTQKQGPYKAGRTLKAQAVARKIEQAMKGGR
jgi:hypothetical protein